MKSLARLIETRSLVSGETGISAAYNGKEIKREKEKQAGNLRTIDSSRHKFKLFVQSQDESTTRRHGVLPLGRIFKRRGTCHAGVRAFDNGDSLTIFFVKATNPEPPAATLVVRTFACRR